MVNNNIQLHNGFRQSAPNSTEIQGVDFSGNNRAKSIQSVNDWASRVSRGTINQILNPSGQYENTKMLLASAVFFRDEWRDAFKSVGTKQFTQENGQIQNVPFMSIEHWFRYDDIISNGVTKTGQWVEIPYAVSNHNFNARPLKKELILFNFRMINSKC